MYTLIATQTNIFIAREKGLHLLQLVELAFLGAEDFQIVEKDLLGDDRASLSPSISPE
jgi:hypothetical protein